MWLNCFKTKTIVLRSLVHLNTLTDQGVREADFLEFNGYSRL